MKPDIQRVIELQKLLIEFSQIDRKIHRQHGDDYKSENDTEHSYDLAMVAWYLASWFPELNKDQIIQYALVHDLVEVHAGDTYIFADKSHLASKQQRENEALIKLEATWKDLVI